MLVTQKPSYRGTWFGCNEHRWRCVCVVTVRHRRALQKSAGACSWPCETRMARKAIGCVPMPFNHPLFIFITLTPDLACGWQKRTWFVANTHRWRCVCVATTRDRRAVQRSAAACSWSCQTRMAGSAIWCVSMLSTTPYFFYHSVTSVRALFFVLFLAYTGSCMWVAEKNLVCHQRAPLAMCLRCHNQRSQKITFLLSGRRKNNQPNH